MFFKVVTIISFIACTFIQEKRKIKDKLLAFPYTRNRFNIESSLTMDGRLVGLHIGIEYVC